MYKLLVDFLIINLFNLFYIVGDLAFITFGHHALIASNRKGAIDGVFYCIILAAVFTGLQYYEYSEAAFTMSYSVYGSAFYSSTGLHSLHVIVGTIFILVGLIIIINYFFINIIFIIFNIFLNIFFFNLF